MFNGQILNLLKFDSLNVVFYIIDIFSSQASIIFTQLCTTEQHEFLFLKSGLECSRITRLLYFFTISGPKTVQ